MSRAEFEDLSDARLTCEYRRLNQLAAEAKENANKIMAELNRRYEELHSKEVTQ